MAAFPVQVAEPRNGPADFGKFLRLPGVYAVQSDSRLLAETLWREGVGPHMSVLDVCTGTGALGVYAARLGARVTAVDISRRAVLATRLNAALSRQRVTVRRGDLMGSLPDRSFDLVVSNPPYVPAPATRPPRRGPARAWDAGHNGRILVDRICESAPHVLRPRGVLLMVHSGLCGSEETLDRLGRAGMKAAVVDRAHVPFGPVLQGRLDWLRKRGLLDAHQDREELVIIRAEKV
ncbi:HemK2/MTQ2 family protein methyltransferase [Streptomyces liangshanensis]|uniref:Methyltransferase n=1 Tax=Streptomyces liangshanensis TaxID=2717324 RepID=A0A6G9H781_9ACTN|nr:HemK2/MTQ2 family protein methyltransferase [Streptomyces liangshanensis]QIQ06350.1 methyltransferase [Streptomyces liangshanensis]